MMGEIAFNSPIRRLVLGGSLITVGTACFAIIIWMIIDAFVPLVGHSFLSGSVWHDVSLRAGLQHLFEMIKECGLTTAMTFRIYIVLATTAFFAVAMFYWVWGWVAHGELPYFNSPLQISVMLMLISFSGASLLAFHGPPSPQTSAACLADKQFLFRTKGAW